jgi:hypothetical protein
MATQNNNDIVGRVKAGMEYLDATFPGWRTRIDTEVLYIGSVRNCILAQVTGQHYSEACDELGLSLDEEEAYGFSPQADDDNVRLTRAWRTALNMVK